MAVRNARRFCCHVEHFSETADETRARHRNKDKGERFLVQRDVDKLEVYLDGIKDKVFEMKIS